MSPRFAQSKEDLVSFDHMMSMTGLEYMERILTGELPSPPIGETLNFAVSAVEKGSVTFTGTPQFPHCNPMGSVHGGWYGGIMDSALACSVMTMLERGTSYTTLEYKVNITRSIPLDTAVNAVGHVQHFGRSTGVAVAELRGVENGKLYATGSTTCIVLRP
jgi:uncharacterized protein (TIGR00369 family)